MSGSTRSERLSASWRSGLRAKSGTDVERFALARPIPSNADRFPSLRWRGWARRDPFVVPLVGDIRRQPTRHDVDVGALAARVVLELIAADAAEAEVRRFWAPEIPAAHRRSGEHREGLGQRNARAPFGV